MMLGLAQFRLTGKHLAGVGELAINPGQKRSRDWLMLAGGLSLLAALTTFALAGILRIDPVWLAGKTANAIVALAVLFFGWTFCFAGLTKEEKKRVGVIVVLFAASATFWAGFEQVGSSFTLFAERYTIREWGGWKVAAGSFQSLGPFFVVTLAPVVAWLWIALGRRQIAPSLATKFAWGLLLLAAGFLVAAWAAQRALSSGPVWPTWLITVYLLHTIGELFLSPVGLSAVTKLSPARLAGQMMGVWFLGTALGNLIAGRIAGEVSGENAAAMPAMFLQAVGTAGGAGLLLWWCSGRIQRLMPGVK
jgi:POT family proton-dependent oligopeptide transporter